MSHCDYKLYSWCELCCYPEVNVAKIYCDKRWWDTISAVNTLYVTRMRTFRKRTSNFFVLRSHNNNIPAVSACLSCSVESAFFNTADTEDFVSIVAEHTNDVPAGLQASETILQRKKVWFCQWKCLIISLAHTGSIRNVRGYCQPSSEKCKHLQIRLFITIVLGIALNLP